MKTYSEDMNLDDYLLKVWSPVRLVSCENDRVKVSVETSLWAEHVFSVPCCALGFLKLEPSPSREDETETSSYPEHCAV